MPDITEDERIWKLKSKTIVLGILAIFIFTTPIIISAALTFYEFKTVQLRLSTLELKHDEDTDNIKVKHDEDDEKTNNRIDKKTDRNKEAIEKLNKK